MAEAFAKHYGKGEIEVMSAGTIPPNEVNPVVFQVMQERGFDVSKNKLKPLGMQWFKKQIRDEIKRRVEKLNQRNYLVVNGQ